MGICTYTYLSPRTFSPKIFSRLIRLIRYQSCWFFFQLLQYPFLGVAVFMCLIPNYLIQTDVRFSTSKMQKKDKNATCGCDKYSKFTYFYIILRIIQTVPTWCGVLRLLVEFWSHQTQKYCYQCIILTDKNKFTCDPIQTRSRTLYYLLHNLLSWILMQIDAISVFAELPTRLVFKSSQYMSPNFKYRY